MFVVEQICISKANGWWLDEYFSLWMTNPDLTFLQAYGRFRTDLTPPLYYVLLYHVRQRFSVPGMERTDVLMLNCAFIVAVSIAVAAASRRRDILTAAIGIGAFLLSGPVLAFAPEARAYLMAMAVVFATSWATALSIDRHSSPPHWGSFAALGALGALSHFYAALMCVALASALLFVALLTRRSELVKASLALGGIAVAVFSLWLLTAGDWIEDIRWIRATNPQLMDLADYARQFIIGNILNTALLIGLLLVALLDARTRPLASTFIFAYAIFIVAPIVISTKLPVMNKRYWLIGGPAFVTLLVFLGRAWMMSDSDNAGSRRSLRANLSACAAGVLLLSSSATGWTAALQRTQTKPTWKGTEIVTPLLSRCAWATVHVLDPHIELYAEAADAPVEWFHDAGRPQTPLLLPARSRCRVLGWMEHAMGYGPCLRAAADTELLRLLKIKARPGEVTIYRHSTGCVVLRRDY